MMGVHRDSIYSYIFVYMWEFLLTFSMNTYNYQAS